MNDSLRNKSDHHDEINTLQNRINELEMSLKLYQEASIEKRNFLESTNDYLQAIIDNIADPTLVIRPDYSIALANKKIRDLSGRDPAKEQLTCFEVSHKRKKPCRGKNDPCPLKKVLKSKTSCSTSHVHYDSKGKEVIVDIVVSPILDKDGEVLYAIESCRDITDRTRMEKAVRKSELMYRSLFEQSVDAIFILQGTGPEAGRILSANKSACLMHGYTEEEILKLHIGDLDSAEDAARAPERILQIIDNKPLRFEVMHKKKDGTLFPVEVTASLINTGDQIHILAIDRDITRRKHAEAERTRLIEKLKHLSRRDGLTGVLNRQYLDKRISEEIHRAKRYGTPLSLLIFDIDKFKNINDSYGHVAGDRVLKKAAEIVNRTIRDTDVAGRFGGDEFIVLLTHTDLNVGMEVAERVREGVEKARVPSGKNRAIQFSISIGICEYDDEIKTPQEFVAKADQALYRAKDQGSNQVCTI